MRGKGIKVCRQMVNKHLIRHIVGNGLNHYLHSGEIVFHFCISSKQVKHPIEHIFPNWLFPKETIGGRTEGDPESHGNCSFCWWRKRPSEAGRSYPCLLKVQGMKAPIDSGVMLLQLVHSLSSNSTPSWELLTSKAPYMLYRTVNKIFTI